MKRAKTIPNDVPSFRKSYNLMEHERRHGKDPWGGFNRGLWGYSHYYQTAFGVTKDEADQLAARLLAVMCGTDDE
jgi:hypothetical protein